MRVLLQIVDKASVTIDEKVHSSINNGYLLYIGFTEGDDLHTLEKMCKKIKKLRVFPDENGKTNLSIADVKGEVMSVSQFTLYANAKEGNRPSFVKAMPFKEAEKMFALWNNLLTSEFDTVATGVFGADMEISSINHGPFTLWLDSKEIF